MCCIKLFSIHRGSKIIEICCLISPNVRLGYVDIIIQINYEVEVKVTSESRCQICLAYLFRNISNFLSNLLFHMIFSSRKAYTLILLTLNHIENTQDLYLLIIIDSKQAVRYPTSIFFTIGLYQILYNNVE